MVDKKNEYDNGKRKGGSYQRGLLVGMNLVGWVGFPYGLLLWSQGGDSDPTPRQELFTPYQKEYGF